MAVSRPLLLALLGLVLATATLFAARGASQSAAGNASNAAVATPAPTPVSPAPPKKAKDPTGPVTGKDKARDKSAKPQASDDVTPARKSDEPARRPLRAKAPLPDGVPAGVGRALRERQVVVLFFGQGGADDFATAEAVASLRGLERVAVFRDGIQNLGKYPGIVSGLGVAQAPAVVIVGKKRRARLIEGFVDSGTLRQQVVDAR
jgi:hypothetical protein